jgi:hypothetical protein
LQKDSHKEEKPQIFGVNLFTEVHEFVFRRSIKRSTPRVSWEVQLPMASDKILETKLGWE